MKYHTQNLNEKRGEAVGSMLWHGRGWLKTDSYKEILHTEWMFGKHATGFGVYIEFGDGESNDALMFHICLPLLLSFYFSIGGVKRCKQGHKTGVAIHNGGFWTYFFTNEDDSSSDDPWYAKNYCWDFPWTFKHHLTEIMSHSCIAAQVPIWNDKGKRFMDSYPERKVAEESVSETYDYTYVLKNRTIQKRKAKVYCDRMTWRAKWWPVIPIQKVRTSISVTFNDEVGEKTGSWKGGCIGCGYDMQDGETPLDTLRRMERERKF